MLAGLFRTPQIKHGIDLDRYLPGIYRRKAKGLFDAVAVHPYATTPRDALDAVKETRKIMNRFKDRRTPIWITEIGWATGGSPPTPLTVSPQRQATYLRKAFGLMAANRGAPEDRRSDLVLVAGRARADLVLPHRPVHHGPRPEAGVDCVHRADRRNALIAGRRQAARLASSFTPIPGRRAPR